MKPPAERRRRIGLKGEFILALMPTATVLAVLALVEALSRQRLLFASLASSAFLIYLDPGNEVNSVRTLVVAQMSAATIGLVTYWGLGLGYLSGGTAMVATIALMIVFDAMHPPGGLDRARVRAARRRPEQLDAVRAGGRRHRGAGAAAALGDVAARATHALNHQGTTTSSSRSSPPSSIATIARSRTFGFAR